MIRDLSSPNTGNLAADVPAEMEDLPGGFYLSLVFDVLTITFSLWMGLSYRGFLDGTNSLGKVAFIATIFGALLSLGIYLTPKIMRRVGVLAGTVIGIFLFMVTSNTLAYVGVSAVIMFLFLIWGEALGRARMANTLRISFLHGVGPLLSKATTALTITGLLLFIPFWTPSRVFFSPTDFAIYFRGVGNVLHQFYGEINFIGTFEEFASSLAYYELLNNPDYRKLTPAGQERIYQDTAAKAKENLGNILRIETGDEKKPMASIVYTLILKTLEGLRARFGSWFLIGWLTILFIIFRSIGTILYMVAGGVGFIFLQILFILGALRIKGETQTQEKVEFT